MVYRIIGRAGSGKTALLLEEIKNAHEMGKECIFLTPEQQSLAMEEELCALLGSGYNLTTEVLNFERLPDRIFRETGGAAKVRTDSKTLSLFTALACENAKDKLLVYEASALDKEFTKALSITIDKLESNRISPKDVADAAALLDEEKSLLKNKLFDVGEIYYQYQQIIEKGYADSTAIQKLLLESLKESNFFKGKTVFIDGYYNFTKAEEPIIEMILKSADDTYITILFDENDKSGIFDVNAETLKFTKDAGRGVTDIFPMSKRERKPALEFLEKNIFSSGNATFSDPSQETVKIYSCASPYEESELAAREISRLIRKGYRYKDISIALRDDSAYNGILDTALNSYNIPFYSSEKDEFSSKELSSLILSFLEIAFTDWSTASVLKYATSSFSPLYENEADLLSIYAECWSIRGKKWYGDEEWMMNPSGYKAEFSKREKNILYIVNRARQKLLFALEGQIADLKSKNLTITKGVRTIYDHLIHIKADKMLEAKAKKLMDEGLEDESAKISALWDGIMSILDTLHETAGNVKVTARRLRDLIRLMMDEYKLGALPSFSDSVEVGNASIMRPSKCKVMIVLGMNDGVFPANPPSAGLFSESEKEFLKSVGIESETSSDEFMKNEFLLFYNLCAAPTDKLVFSYSRNNTSGKNQRPSVFLDTITDFFTYNCHTKYIKSKRKANGPHSKALVEESFSENTILTPTEPEILKLSATKMEDYLKCPFSYYCKYVLGLEAFEKAVLSPSEKGTFFHAILEDFARSLFETGTFKSKTKEEIKEFFDDAKEKYKQKVFGEKTSGRESFSFDSNEDLMLPLLSSINEEFANTAFAPAGYEDKAISTYPITDKTTAEVHGKIDRVDVFEANGKKYVRIIDYKTGKKDISTSEVKKGFEMQMLTYLFSKCGPDETPAGVMYFLCGLPESKTALFARKGIMLDDAAVKKETSYLLENKLLGDKSFKSEDEFADLKKIVESNIKNIGKNIIDGNMQAVPDKSKDPCKYCYARLYCRKRLEKE